MQTINDFILLLGGAQVIITALLAFLGKVWLDYLHEQHKGELNRDFERLKAELRAADLKLQASLDKQTHVHKVQFEKELQVYESIWSILVDVRKVTGQLRPLMDSYDPDELEEERINRRLNSFGTTFQRFLDEVNKERPFYADEVYQQIQELIRLARDEALEYRYRRPEDASYWKSALENYRLIDDQIDEICESIRMRIARISVS